VLKCLQVDDQLRWRFDRTAGAAAWQQLRDRDAVESGQLCQALDCDCAVAALV
jgi:hypothetical protein